jgi:hypothetical protein
MRWHWLFGCVALAGAARASDDAPPRPHRGPPPEALQACAGLAEGASCSFTTPSGDELTGTCRSAPDGSSVACAPSQPPPPPQR